MMNETTREWKQFAGNGEPAQIAKICTSDNSTTTTKKKQKKTLHTIHGVRKQERIIQQIKYEML